MGGGLQRGELPNRFTKSCIYHLFGTLLEHIYRACAHIHGAMRLHVLIFPLSFIVSLLPLIFKFFFYEPESIAKSWPVHVVAAGRRADLIPARHT